MPLVVAELGLGQQSMARTHTLELQGRLTRVVSTHHLEILVNDLTLSSLGVVVLSELILGEPTRRGIVSSKVAPESVDRFSRRHLPRCWGYKYFSGRALPSPCLTQAFRSVLGSKPVARTVTYRLAQP